MSFNMVDVMLMSFERIRTGRYDVKVYRHEDPVTYTHTVREPVELRAFVDLNYDLPMEEVAHRILSEYLGAVRVEISDWNHNGIIIEKE